VKAFRIISYIATVGLLVFLVNTQSANLEALFDKISLSEIILISLTSLVAIYFLAWTFSTTCSHLGLDLAWKEYIPLTFVNNLYNLVLPLSGGQAIRARYLKKIHGFNYSKYVSYLVSLYAINLLVSGLLAFTLTIFYYYSGESQEGFLLLVAILFLGAIVLFYALFYLRVGLPKSVVFQRLAQIKDHTAQLTDRSFLLKITGGYLLRLLAMNLRLFWTLKFLGVKVGFLKLLVVQAILQFLAIFSITPGNLGIRELAVAYCSGFLGLDFTAVLNATLFERATMMVVLLIGGTVSILYFRFIAKVDVLQ